MTADTVGGVWQYATELAEGLAPHGVDVVLLTMGATLDRHQREVISRIPNVAVHESSFKLEWMNDPWREVDAAGDWILDIAATEQPDVVQLNHLAHGWLAFEAPVVGVVHSCVNSWWEAVHGTRAPAEWRRYNQCVQRHLEHLSSVVVASFHMASCVSRLYPGVMEPTTIPNASRVRLSHPEAHSDREPIVLAAGRLWDPAKNILALDAAAPEIAWPVVVAGATHSPDGSRISPVNCRSTDVLSHESLQALMRRASIYALPARYEPFGLSILEAAHAGCALVLGDIPSLRENWSGAALFVNPNSPSDLASAVNSLIHDNGKRARLALLARQRALGMRHECTSQSYVELYRALTSSGVPALTRGSA